MSWDKILELMKTAPPLSPEDREAHRRSFVYGNTAIENPLITKDMVDEIATTCTPPSGS